MANQKRKQINDSIKEARRQIGAQFLSDLEKNRAARMKSRMDDAELNRINAVFRRMLLVKDTEDEEANRQYAEAARGLVRLLSAKVDLEKPVINPNPTDMWKLGIKEYSPDEKKKGP